MLMSPFKAYLIDQKDGKTVAGFTHSRKTSSTRAR
jgi:hypothetical protein